MAFEPPKRDVREGAFVARDFVTIAVAKYFLAWLPSAHD